MDFNLEDDLEKDLENKIENEKFTIDRIEDDIVVLENRTTNEIVDVERSLLPKNIFEGDIVELVDGRFVFNEELTEEIEERIKKKMDDLWG